MKRWICGLLCGGVVVTSWSGVAGAQAAKKKATYDRKLARQGKTLWYRQCWDCHDLDKNEKMGPALRSVWGRRAGQVEGFAYSAALQRSKLVWDQDTLERWLKNPDKLIPGNIMNVSFPQAQERRAMIEFLRSLSVKKK